MAEYLIIAVVVVAAITVLILNKRKKKSKKEGADVPQGLQVFDAKGNITLDLTDRLTKCLGQVEVNGANIAVHDPKITEGDFWSALFWIDPNTQRGTAIEIPKVTRSGEYIKFIYDGVQVTPNVRKTGVKAHCKFMYGVY